MSDQNSDQNVGQGSAAKIVTETIRNRVTFKVLTDVDSPTTFSKEVVASSDALVVEAIKEAGLAPFHYDRGIDSMAEPWRAHLIRHDGCRTIAKGFHDWFDDVKPTNKLPAMLSACGALVLVNWIPQFRGNQNDAAENESLPGKDKQLQVDEEHLAATAAMVQNLLLILTAHGMGTYWSSGGQFRTPAMFDKLGISKNERLLAAVFVEYPSSLDLPLERLAGKQRANRSQNAAWLREITL